MGSRHFAEIAIPALLTVAAVTAIVLVAQSSWWLLAVVAGAAAIVAWIARILVWNREIVVRVTKAVMHVYALQKLYVFICLLIGAILAKFLPGLAAGTAPAVPQAMYRMRCEIGADLWTSYRKLIDETVKSGSLTLAAPDHMRQGTHSNVLVKINADAGIALADSIGANFGQGTPNRYLSSLAEQTVPIKVSPVMSVECQGDGFVVTPLSAVEQALTADTFWNFDILAQSSGRRALVLIVNLRLPMPDFPNMRYSVPTLEHKIDVEVNALYTARSFWIHNWQWVIATFVGLGGAITAWLKMFGS